MILDSWNNSNTKMITEMEKKMTEITKQITEITQIDSGDTMNLSNHRCDLFFYLRHHPERSEEVR